MLLMHYLKVVWLLLYAVHRAVFKVRRICFICRMRSVDHGSNREPCGAVRATNRTAPHPTVRFVSETEPLRHGSVRGGYEPWRFVAVRHGS